MCQLRPRICRSKMLPRLVFGAEASTRRSFGLSSPSCFGKNIIRRKNTEINPANRTISSLFAEPTVLRVPRFYLDFAVFIHNYFGLWVRSLLFRIMKN